MFGFQVDADARAHAVEAFPYEACGAVAGGVYHRCRNIAPDPRHAFDADPADLVRAAAAGPIQGLIHSHPDVGAGVSKADMEGQLAWDVPWGITLTDGKDAWPVVYWGPGVPIPPLVGRDFRHGPSGSDGKGDCYALIKDWYQVEQGIALREGPRDPVWWSAQAGGNLYLDNFQSAGFREVSVGADRHFQPQIGDVFLAAIRSPVPNHGGVYVGEGRILHHLAGRLSKVDLVHTWASYLTHWIRHQDLEGRA